MFLWLIVYVQKNAQKIENVGENGQRDFFQHLNHISMFKSYLKHGKSD